MKTKNILLKITSILALGLCLAGCKDTGNESMYSFDQALYVNKATLAMYRGEQEQLLVSPEETAGQVSWTSDDEAVVTVVGGLVTAVETGATDIIAVLGTERRVIPVSVTTPKPDKVTTHDGEGRLALDIHIANDRIQKLKIVNRTAGTETDVEIDYRQGVFRKLYTGLSEGEYTFMVYSYDRFDLLCDSTEAKAVVVGNTYTASLVNRPFKAATQWGNCCGIAWTDATGTFIDLYYTNEQGETVEKRVKAGTNYGIADFKRGSVLSYRTVFLPGDAPLDTFYMPVVQVAVTDKSYTLTSDVPCEIFAKDFDYGGEGIGFHDTNTSNTARPYRRDLGDDGSEAVRLDDATHLNIGSAGAFDWYAYTVEVRDEGNYQVDVQYGTTGTGGMYSIEIDQAKTPLDILLNKATGGWQAYQWSNAHVPVENPPVFHLTPGKHRIKFISVSGFNFKSFKLTWLTPNP
ncbi:MAG: carbohydrate-binding protein [Bacteroidales bacterium]|nr:carbohydrate-binding protein [Bacteroidales bacterium]